MLKFKKLNSGAYQAVRLDGKKVTIEPTYYEEVSNKWRMTTEGEDCSELARTKKELVEYANYQNNG